MYRNGVNQTGAGTKSVLKQANASSSHLVDVGQILNHITARALHSYCLVILLLSSVCLSRTAPTVTTQAILATLALQILPRNRSWKPLPSVCNGILLFWRRLGNAL
eukprot:1357887-Rhodomonas_salina.1